MGQFLAKYFQYDPRDTFGEKKPTFVEVINEPLFEFMTMAETPMDPGKVFEFHNTVAGEIRKLNQNCRCTIGQVGNRDHMNEVSGKAGRSRWKGIRPTVRGMCMNPVDHPNGGGEGKSKSGGGRQHLKSPWGHTKGQKTRKKYKPSNKFIVERRKNKKRSR